LFSLVGKMPPHISEVARGTLRSHTWMTAKAFMSKHVIALAAL